MGPTDYNGIGNDDGNNDDDGGGQVWDWEAELPPEAPSCHLYTRKSPLTMMLLLMMMTMM